MNDDDSFSFNHGFTANLAKIKIQTIANKVETPEERKETEAKVEAARSTLCDVSSGAAWRGRRVVCLIKFRF